MDDCAECGDTKPMHARCEACGAEVCSSCYSGSSMPCPNCGEERMELIP